MARHFTPAQARENRAFLKALGRNGNTRRSAREVGVAVSTMFYRRSHDAAFAQAWDAALAVAHARLHRAGPPAPEAAGAGSAHHTAGGEPAVYYRPGGKLQIRAAHPGKITRACEQAFLSALSATANIRLSAAAAGASVVTFYRRRKRSPAFAREMQLALQMGYDRIEMELLASFDPASHADDAWRRNDPPPIPSMTANQALQLMYLHQKQARLEAEPAHIKRRRGESREAHSYRLGAMGEARLQRDREAFDIAEAERRAAGRGHVVGPDEIAPLPDLAQVTGWSKADPARLPHDATRALFGGWRLSDRARRGRGPAG